MSDIVNFILGMAKSSQNTGKKNKLVDLADALNKNGYKTSRGGSYSGTSSRGAARVLSTVYDKVNKVNPDAASEIADNFVAKDGKQAWLKK